MSRITSYFSTSINRFSLDFDSVNERLTVPDAANLSFGDSVTDNPFSITAWVKMDDATKFRIINKRDASNVEWDFNLGLQDKLALALFDLNTSNFIGRQSSNALTSDEGIYIHVAITYDGTSSVNGINIYKNGVLLIMTDNGAGSYVAMHNTTSNVFIGGAPAISRFANGKIDEVKIIGKELSAAEVLEDYNNGKVPKRTLLSFFANLISLWAMGDGATFSGGNWTIPDEIGSNTATSVNMEEVDRKNDVP